MILACQRADKHKSWQFPQGGVDPGESIEVAARRELLEEIGTTRISILATLESPIRYDWPVKYIPIPGFHGQEQYYFLVQLLEDAVINLENHEPQEFQDYLWVSVKEFFELEIGFKEETYRKALALFISKFPNTILEE
ncbi:UNVERIFIED_CONTAM: hypothetical protein GTU68_061638 [Idotea baltica]|nr:hypothetical protein [Idotea baltica]